MENLLFFRCPKIWAHYSLIIICLNIGTPNNHHFPFGTNGKVVVLGVPILKHFRVLTWEKQYALQEKCFLIKLNVTLKQNVQRMTIVKNSCIVILKIMTLEMI